MLIERFKKNYDILKKAKDDTKKQAKQAKLYNNNKFDATTAYMDNKERRTKESEKNYAKKNKIPPYKNKDNRR